MEFMPIQKDMHIAVDDIICNELSNEGQKKAWPRTASLKCHEYLTHKYKSTNSCYYKSWRPYLYGLYAVAR